MNFSFISSLSAALIALLLPLAGRAQSTVATIEPGRHERSAWRTTNVKATFSLAVTSQMTSLKVLGSQREGLKAGSYSLNSTGLGYNGRIIFDPTTAFRAGELVTVLLPNTVRLGIFYAATKQVLQFTTETTGDGSFTGSTNYGTGATPKSVVAADLNGDGALDLVTANATGNTLSVRSNSGTGTFGPASTFTGDNTPNAVVAADVDLDGDLDLLTANGGNSTVLIRYNNGSGAFPATASVSSGSGTGPVALAVADLDGDADLDLLTLNGNNTVSVLLCTATGANSSTYAAAVTYAVGSNSLGLAVGDVDNDGDLDVATTSLLNNTVTVLPNNDNGTLGTASTVAVGTNPTALALADISGAGYLDLLTANLDGTVSVCLNTGTGTGSFGAATSLTVGGNASALALGDLDGDQDMDLLVADYANSRVALRLNNGTGTLSGSTTVAVDNNPTALALADLNGDGALDLVTANGTAATASVRLNHIPAPAPAAVTPTAAAIGSSVVVTGQYFTGATGVTINGVAATYTADSFGQLTVTVPAGASTGLLRVTTSYGSGSIALSVLPTVTSFTPGSGEENLTAVVVTGSAFVGVTGVAFNGAAATSYTVDSPTQLTATVPAGATTGPLRVTTVSGAGSSSGSFTVTPGITAFSPGSGAEGSSVTLTGTYFTGATAVTFGGVPATSYTVNSATQITATVPAGALTGLLQVTAPGYGTRSSGSSFTVLPAITGFTPAGGAIGSTVVISGTTLTGATGVQFGGTNAASYVVNSATKLTAVVASGTSSGTITVTTPTGTATSSNPFTLPPTFTSFSPASGVAGVDITLTGTNFIGASGVSFNGVAATFTSHSNTRITATVPATALSGPITVTSAAGSATSATSFVITPVLATMTPGSGVVGTVVTITGTNLTNLTGVSFNGTAATSFTLNSVTQLTATVPAGATTGLVTVAVSGSTASLAVPFQVRTATVVATAPTREASNQALSVRPAATFSQAPAGGATAASLKVYSTQRGGKRSGSLSGSGTFTSTFTPTLPFQPGERVQVTAPGAAGGVWQFRTAVTGTGNTYQPIGYTGSVGFEVGSASGDLDNDGDMDVVACSWAYGFWALRNGGSGSFSFWQYPNSTAPYTSVALADMDGDGDLDAVLGLEQFGIHLYRNDGTGQLTYAGACAISGNGPHTALDIGDVDGDGDLDVAAGNDDSASICFNDGTGTLTAVRVVGEAGDHNQSSYMGPVKLRDMDGDGDLDLLRGERAVLVLYLNPGNGRMSQDAASTYTSLNGEFGVLLAEDFDGDGDVDVVCASTGGTNTLLLNDGTGQMTLRSSVSRPTSGSSKCWADVGDVDGDGDLDMVCGYNFTDNVTVLLNDGTGQLTLNGYLTLSEASAGTLGDFDADGDLDLLACSYHSTSGSGSRVFLNGRPPTITAFTPYGAVGATVTLTGTELNNISSLTLNGTAVGSYTRVSSTQVTFAVPAGATSGLISITTPWGTATTSTSFIVVVPGTATVSGLSPASGPVGTSVMVTGTAFTGASSVTFNGVSAAFTLNSATSITATVPATATTGPVVVTAAAGSASSGISFTVTPVVSSFSPGSGVTGATVVLTGTGLTGATALTFNGVSASFTVNSATQLTATVPATATTGVLSVTTAGGTVSK